jgi:hypothetical protein
MRVSALELLLETERIHRKAAVTTGVGFAVPALYEFPAEAVTAPFLVSNSRGSFVLGARSRDGYVRLAFFECPLEDEGPVLTELHRVLWRISVQHGWPNRCTSVAQAIARMKALALEPKAIVVSPSFLEDACGEPVTLDDAGKLMMAQGYVAESDGVKVLAADLPPGSAILAATRAVVGVYVRVDDKLGLMVRKADQSLVLVGDEVA